MFRNLTSQIIFDTGWGWMNVCLKWPFAWNNSSLQPSWRFYLHCGSNGTSSPGIICVICQQVLCYLSEYGTSPMGTHLQEKAPITKVNEFTESEVTAFTCSMVEEISLAILKWRGCRGITIVSSQSHSIFNIQIIPYWPKWQTKGSKLAAEDIESPEVFQATWNHYLMSWFVSPGIPWNALSNTKLQWLFKALRDDILLPSATTTSYISGNNLDWLWIQLRNSCRDNIQ
jgi:hypothetical protein